MGACIGCAAHGGGRTVPDDFTPKRIVFGILLKTART